MTAQTSTPQKIFGQLQRVIRFIVLGDGGERGNVILCPKCPPNQIDFVGNGKMAGGCRLLNHGAMTPPAEVSHPFRVGRLLDQAGMGGILIIGLSVAAMALVTRESVTLPQGQ